ncbi:MauE/DoxX family redox-associated membrane protein [Nocardioides sp.]|uniref:MauE/DoxX family redox-associated membrane protein n=1 Tax=Nocardioides sp. TaxID=35761 RepID=UPI00261CB2DD|nr:MauE/DoxX family redox-associated membrane protein [Nocardioides sp.]MCW2738257.1 Methylamine utilization protein MauE [Nocardioides sp.]
MSSTPVAALVIALTLAAVLLTSGVAKLRDTVATRDAFDALRVPRIVPADAAAAALPWIEIGLAVLLLLSPSGWLVPVTVALVVLMLAYTWLVARALGFDEPVTCSCFGSLGRHSVDRTTLARNVLLVALAAATVWFAVDGGSVPAAFADLDRDGWWSVVAAGAAAAVAVLVVGAPTRARTVADEELLDYERQAIPYAVLTLPDGRTATLSELAALQARLLVVLNPHCGSCVRTAEKLDDWAAQLGPAVGVLAVYPDAATASGATEHAPGLATSEPELNVRRVFSVGTPGAVLLGADGFLAGGPVAGEGRVAQLVEDVLTELAAQPIAHE